jgi:hypothetical protein
MFYHTVFRLPQVGRGEAQMKIAITVIASALAVLAGGSSVSTAADLRIRSATSVRTARAINRDPCSPTCRPLWDEDYRNALHVNAGRYRGLQL